MNGIQRLWQIITKNTQKQTNSIRLFDLIKGMLVVTIFSLAARLILKYIMIYFLNYPIRYDYPYVYIRIIIIIGSIATSIISFLLFRYQTIYKIYIGFIVPIIVMQVMIYILKVPIVGAILCAWPWTLLREAYGIEYAIKKSQK